VAPKIALALLLTVGCTGRTGPPGQDGMDGMDGMAGVMGTMGLPGTTGVQGDKGDKGDPGVNGADGTDGMDGRDGTNGVDGKDGANGMDGANGTNGTNGTNGVDGKDGKDGVSAAQALQAILDKVVPKRAAILNVYCYQTCPVGAAPGDCSAGLMWSRGTGAKLATGDVLTAHHVAENALGCILRGEDNTLVGQSTTVHQPVTGRDLVHVTDVSWAPAGTALPGFEVKKAVTPAVGELVLMASYPGAITRSVQLTFGHVTSNNITASFPIDYRTYWSAAWSSDNASTNGSSGGPVFDSSGDLIGIIVGRPSDDSLDLRFNLPLIW
jgi:hypothetical protein